MKIMKLAFNSFFRIFIKYFLSGKTSHPFSSGRMVVKKIDVVLFLEIKVVNNNIDHLRHLLAQS